MKIDLQAEYFLDSNLNPKIQHIPLEEGNQTVGQDRTRQESKEKKELRK